MNIAVMTGASAGIGRELVRAVDREEQFDEIWVIARRRERLEELAAETRNRLRPIVLDLSDPDRFTDYVSQVEKAALYDTGLTASPGDELLTLSTCSYHVTDGRFVVVAKQVG